MYLTCEIDWFETMCKNFSGLFWHKPHSLIYSTAVHWSCDERDNITHMTMLLCVTAGVSTSGKLKQ